MTSVFLICVLILILSCSPSTCIFLIAPDDVAMAFLTYFGFAPPIFKGNDHRVGFGFRFGNHADLQILYEFGPQKYTKPLQEKSVKPTQRQREVRRPIFEFLLRTGILRRPSSYQYNVVHEKTVDMSLKS